MSWRRLAVVTLVVLAGCAGDPSAVLAGDGPGHPWAGEEVVVTVDGDDRYRSLTQDAMAYWEEEASRYVGFNVSFRLAPDASDPDVRVAVVETVDACENPDHAAGCAPVLNGSQAPDTVEIEVKRGFDDASTRQVLEHEFGHALGLRHGDAPRDVMANVSELTTRPRPDATERALPWSDDELALYVDVESFGDRDREALGRQFHAAAAYVSDGADGTVPDSVTVERVSNRSAADVVVRNDPDADCAPEGASCNHLSGVDPDGDGAIERYTRQNVTLVGADTEAVGWHVGYWLLTALGVEEGERPAPLQPDTTSEQRRSAWWT